jgi:hypothetical protein
VIVCDEDADGHGQRRTAIASVVQICLVTLRL